MAGYLNRCHSVSTNFRHVFLLCCFIRRLSTRPKCSSEFTQSLTQVSFCSYFCMFYFIVSFLRKGLPNLPRRERSSFRFNNLFLFVNPHVPFQIRLTASAFVQRLCHNKPVGLLTSCSLFDYLLTVSKGIGKQHVAHLNHSLIWQLSGYSISDNRVQTNCLIVIIKIYSK